MYKVSANPKRQIQEILERQKLEEKRGSQERKDFPAQPKEPERNFTQNDFHEYITLEKYLREGEKVEAHLVNRHAELHFLHQSWQRFHQELQRYKQWQEQQAMEYNPQSTQLENRTISKKDFIFYAQRDMYLRTQIPHLASTIGLKNF